MSLQFKLLKKAALPPTHDTDKARTAPVAQPKQPERPKHEAKPGTSKGRDIDDSQNIYKLTLGLHELLKSMGQMHLNSNFQRELARDGTSLEQTVSMMYG